jgi:hypothetical protein
MHGPTRGAAETEGTAHSTAGTKPAATGLCTAHFTGVQAFPPHSANSWDLLGMVCQDLQEAGQWQCWRRANLCPRHRHTHARTPLSFPLPPAFSKTAPVASLSLGRRCSPDAVP